MMCPRCGHDAHDDRPDPRCGEIVGGGDTPMPEPVYCECVDAAALLVRVQRAERALKKISNIANTLEGCKQ